jgi:hypothetical protein
MVSSSGLSETAEDAQPTDGCDATYKSFVDVFTDLLAVAARNSLAMFSSDLQFPHT